MRYPIFQALAVALAFGLAWMERQIIGSGGALADACAWLNARLFGFTDRELWCAGIANATLRDRETVLKEMKALQDKYKGKAWDQGDGETFDKLALEVKEIDDAEAREKQVEDFEAKGRRNEDPSLPGGDPGARPSAVKREDQVVAYLTPGRLFAYSDALALYVKAGLPAGQTSAPVPIPGLVRSPELGMGKGLPLVPISRKMWGELQQKAAPVLGAGVILPERLTEVVRATELEQLTMRDVLNVQTTTSNAIQYVRIATATREAAPVAEQAAKPEAALTTDVQTVAVKTIAVWMPVTEQQLQDFPQVEGMINVELRFDLALEEEQQIVWGDGTGQNLLGLMNVPGILNGAARAEVGDTLVDKVRRAMTDVRVVGRGIPSVGLVHPYEWEAMVLLKGTDMRYVWAVVQDGPTLRLWSLRMVESTAMEEPSDAETPQREIIVMDGMRAAALYDYLRATVAVGWINDQFIKNMRTIRAEERVALATKRPKMIAHITAQAEVP